MPTAAEWYEQNKGRLSMEAVPSVAANQAMLDNRKAIVPDSSATAFGHAAANRFAGNIANIPDVVANLGARSINQAVSSAVPDVLKPSSYQREGGDVRNAMMPENKPLIPVPTIGQDFVPGPTGSDLMGLVQRGGELAGAIKTGDFNQFRPDASAQQQARTDAFAEQNPVATMLGTISGDMLTLITGRQPIAAGRGRANLLADVTAKRAAAGSHAIETAPNVASALKMATANSKGVRSLLNKVGRAGETGLEGFTLAALNGEADPLETFGYAAGTQAAGSILLSSMGGIFSGGVGKAGIKIAASAAAIGAITELFRSGTMGTDDPLGSLATGFDKVLLGMAAGVVSGASGMGRVTKGFPVRALPDIADVITSMPRAATLSIITQMQDDPAADAVVKKLATDPYYFPSAARRQLEKAFNDGDVSLSATIDTLMENREFRTKFEAIGK